MSRLFDQTDFSVVVKRRASPPKPWRWEIYRAGRTSAIECSSVRYETVEAANRAGNEALRQLLTEVPNNDKRPTVRDPELELWVDVGRVAVGCIDEREDGHVSG